MRHCTRENVGKCAYPAGAQEGRHLRFPPSCEFPLSLGESGADCRHVTAAKIGERQRIFFTVGEHSVLPCPDIFAASDKLLLHMWVHLRRRDIPVSRKSLARCNARHLRIKRLVQFILVGAVYHNALTNCAALLCRAQRRFSDLCSSNVSDTANRLRKIRKKKSSAVPLFGAVTYRKSAPG